MPGVSFFPYLSYFINFLLKPPTSHLSDVITSEFNLVRWSWQGPCVHRPSITMYVRVLSRVLSHIDYINLDLRRHFLISGYCIFLFLRCAMSYPQTISTYWIKLYTGHCRMSKVLATKLHIWFWSVRTSVSYILHMIFGIYVKNCYGENISRSSPIFHNPCCFNLRKAVVSYFIMMTSDFGYR